MFFAHPSRTMSSKFAYASLRPERVCTAEGTNLTNFTEFYIIGASVLASALFSSRSLETPEKLTNVETRIELYEVGAMIGLVSMVMVRASLCHTRLVKQIIDARDRLSVESW